MQEIRCEKCNKMFGKIFNPTAIAIEDRQSVEKIELHNNGHPKRLEIQCPRCKTLNEIMV